MKRLIPALLSALLTGPALAAAGADDPFEQRFILLFPLDHVLIVDDRDGYVCRYDAIRMYGVGRVEDGLSTMSVRVTGECEQWPPPLVRPCNPDAPDVGPCLPQE